MTNASLHWIDDEGRERQAFLDAVETILGRSVSADITILDKRVSRQHAKIKKTQHGYLLLDLASQYGTFVNGQPVGHHFLRDGDRIQLSDYQIEILFCQATEQTRDSTVSDAPATPPQEVIQILSFEYRSEMASSKKTRRLLEDELSLAHEVQESLLPHSLPDHGPFRIRAFSKPTRKVGGDFYDFLQAESGELVGILVDVSGKGVAASLLSSMILGFVQAQVRTGSTLDQTVDGLNRFMCERCPGHFATMFVFTLNEAGQGSFISGGHNTAYLLKPSAIRIEELSSNNTLVGAFPTVHYETSAFTLDAGDVLLIYSDGLTEAENPEGDMLGEEAIRQVLLTEPTGGALHLENKLFETLRAFTRGQSQGDDITIVIIERVRE